MRIVFIPIDNRPVCYTLPQQIAQIDESVELVMPKREWLGDLTKCADIDKIFEWLRNLSQFDAVIISLDTIAYGGLIPSRRSSDSLDMINQRLKNLKEILFSQKGAKIYAFSSIMRISNNNVNEEEKIYWSDWGKKIFEYSYNLDKYGFVENNEIPEDILEDYLKTREKNFEINKIYLEWQKSGFLDTLIFSKDDCAQFGLNVREAKELEKLGGFVKTGADEIPLSLLSRVLNPVKVAPVFLEPEYKDLISNYEDISVEKSVLGQLELANCTVTGEKDADIVLFVNNFKKNQGEIVMGVDTEPFNQKWNKPQKPYMVADVRFANGADNRFVKEFFKFGLDEKFYGYSAWNTTANTLGSLICAMKFRFLAKKYNDKAFKRVQLVRLLDDWAYQANVRQKKPDLKQLKSEMKKYEQIVFDKINLVEDLEYKFPWNRFFEVEIEFN